MEQSIPSVSGVGGPSIASKYKVVFLGDASVGKTCLINRFINDTFEPDYKVFFIRKNEHVFRSLLVLIFFQRK